ncbi:MAG: hypothetical protein HYS32_02240 [Candidatus Woesearchaeota archaeon]|nr:MAG: hypothetical protein HYS32_02240 [Candidatus Woesearchaeota archaeon]
MGDYLKYYSRKEIQKEIVASAVNREVAVQLGDKGFGRRPDVLHFEGDVLELAKQGATSFHVSVEHWSDPLKLESGMPQRDLDNLRSGWDLIIDIDTKFLEYAKETALLIIEALKFQGINNVSIKYSGGSGFHIGLPFKSFPKESNNQKITLLFPEGARIIASYLKNLLGPHLAERILSLNTLNEMAKSINKDQKDLMTKGKFDPYKLVNLDTVLISSRHMYRAPYSINEKKGLVSLPITENQISNFNITQAKPEKVEVITRFLDDSKYEPNESKNLFLQAFDWNAKNKKIDTIQIKQKDNFSLPKIAIKDATLFPQCIQKILLGIKEDGRKRSVFVLFNFLQNMGWSIEDIEKLLLEWNKNNYEQLRDGYIKSQVSWYKKQNKVVMPPNCSNESYYLSMGVKCEESICSKCKNPVNYTLRRIKTLNENKNKSSKKKSQGNT